MKDERLSELRDRAKHVTTQIDVLQDAEQLVAFFESISEKLQEDGIFMPLNDNRVRICGMPSSSSTVPCLLNNLSLAPTHAIDKEKELWLACMKEMHAEVYAGVLQVLRKYTQQAVVLRDEALCDVCGAASEPRAARQPRGVKVREK